MRYVRLSNGTVPSVEKIPMSMMLIRMKSGASDPQKDDVIAQLEQASDANTDVLLSSVSFLFFFSFIFILIPSLHSFALFLLFISSFYSLFSSCFLFDFFVFVSFLIIVKRYSTTGRKNHRWPQPRW